MSAQRGAARLLRVIGVLLTALGVIHLVATPHIPELLSGSSPAVSERAVGPMLLNHVLVGVLLLPLGYTTWAAAAAAAHGEKWAVRVLLANTLVVLSFPLALLIFMRQPEYYTGPLFLSAVILVGIIAALTATATVLLIRGDRPNLG